MKLPWGWFLWKQWSCSHVIELGFFNVRVFFTDSTLTFCSCPCVDGMWCANIPFMKPVFFYWWNVNVILLLVCQQSSHPLHHPFCREATGTADFVCSLCVVWLKCFVFISGLSWHHNCIVKSLYKHSVYTEFGSCVKVKVAIICSLSLLVLMVSVDLKQQ